MDGAGTARISFSRMERLASTYDDMKLKISSTVFSAERPRADRLSPEAHVPTSYAEAAGLGGYGHRLGANTASSGGELAGGQC